MLIQFSVENYRSFREEQTLSMVASKDAAHQDCLIPCEKDMRLSRVAAIYGANASGKSNLIKAMRAMEQFVTTSATRMNLGYPIEFVSPYRLDATTAQKPSRFEITLLIDNDTYIYGFSATRERVYEEWLHVRPNGKRISKWLDRTRDIETGKASWNFRGPLKKDAKLLQEKTRDNGLVLSRAAELNVDAVKPLFKWFSIIFAVYDLSVPPRIFAKFTAKQISKNESKRDRVIQFLQDADFGITGLNVSEEVAEENSPKSYNRALQEAISRLDKRLIESSQLTVTTVHSGMPGHKPVSFNLEEDESNGTQRLFALAEPILMSLDLGVTVVIDEIDCSMHPLLTRKIIELFQNPESNPNNAQLIFATHDSSLMDSSLLRRDQIWYTEKKSTGATSLFSLYDFKTKDRPRGKAALEKNYLSGRFGAIPNFGPTFEDLQLE